MSDMFSVPRAASMPMQSPVTGSQGGTSSLPGISPEQFRTEMAQMQAEARASQLETARFAHQTALDSDEIKKNQIAMDHRKEIIDATLKAENDRRDSNVKTVNAFSQTTKQLQF